MRWLDVNRLASQKNHPVGIPECLHRVGTDVKGGQKRNAQSVNSRAQASSRPAAAGNSSSLNATERSCPKRPPLAIRKTSE